MLQPLGILLCYCFLVGIAATVCFLIDMQRYTRLKDRILNIGWLGIITIFILLSFDEMGSFHEMIGETALFKKMGHDTGAGWVAFYALIGITGLFMIIFFILKFKTNKLALLLTVLAVLLFLSNPFQEKYEINAYRNAANPATWKRPMFFLLLEEGSEIFASFFFLYSFVIYSIAGTGSGNDRFITKMPKT